MAATPNYNWSYPTVNADADAWGSVLNAALIAADASLFAVEGAAPKKANNLSDMNAALCRTNIGLGTAATVNITVSASPPSGSGNPRDVWIMI